MAEILQGQISTTLADFFALIGPFLSTNGWTLDVSTSERIHAHKGSVHIEIFATYAMWIVGCTGYDSGSTWNNQPGKGQILIVSNETLGFACNSSHPLHYLFISTESAFYIMGFNTLENSTPALGFGNISSKIGNWSGGSFYMGNVNFNYSIFCAGGYLSSSIFMDSAWTPMLQTGGINGLWDINTSLRQKMPFSYSAGILPQPIMLFQRDEIVNTNFHPIGLLPDIMSFQGGDVYAQLEEVIINTDTYTAVNYQAGHQPASNPPNFLVKLGS